MNLIPLVAVCFIFVFFLGCSSTNLDKEFDCEGTKVKFNDYERFFEVGGMELSAQQDFFMNQITIFGKFNQNIEGALTVTFNKINQELELKDAKGIITKQCIELF
tara:strand:+ start:218 stop:532 length:315 start_codon:yes stop_codon:yes gene_type:complete